MMSNMSEHPCHNLSNTDKQIFTCRHCMAKFYDPIQRWRHSKSCKKDAPTKSREGIPLSNGKRDLPVETAERGGLGKKRQKKENPLNCVICKSVFTSLEEMKEHVRNPCSKPPPEPKSQALAPPNPELENFEQQLQQLQEAKGEDMATNQIESLLRAAQALHQQQQEQQRQQAEQLQNVETEVIPDGGNPDWLYNQGEPVLCSVEEYGEPGFPNYSSIQGSDGLPVVQVEQVSSTPAIEEERSLHTPPIKLTAEEYDPVTPQEITVTSGHDVHDKCAVSSYSEQQILDMKQGNGTQEVLLKEGSSNTQGALSDEKFIFSSVGLVESIESQTPTTGTQDLYSISAHPSVLPSEVKLVGSDGVTVTLVLSPNASTDTLQKSGNPGDEFDFISQVIGEDLTQQGSIEKQDSQDSKIICNIDTKEKCGFNKEVPELNSSSVSVLSQTEQSGEAIACERDNLNTAADECVKDKQFNRSEKTKCSDEIDIEQSPFKEKNSLQSTTNEPLVNTNSESDNLTSADLKVSCNQQTNNDDTSTEGIEKNQKNSRIIELGDKAQGGIHKEKVDSPDQVKVVKKIHKNVKIPKCRVCDKEFKTKEQLRKHNKVPCKVRLTRNLTQKVLRPKRLEKSVPLPIVKKKKKQKPVPAKPKMITLINRRFADRSLDLNKEKKGKFKTRRKSLYDYNFCITRSTDYRNANLDVLVQYDSLNEQEQHFFHLGLVGTNHLPSHYRTPKSLIKRVLKQNGSNSMEKVLEREEPLEDGPPVLEKVVDASGRIQEDIYILRDEYHHDIEPPVLMTVEKLDAGCSLEERFETSTDMMCPTLDDELTENYKLPNSESCNKEKLENNEPNKENSFHHENLSANKASEQNSIEEQKIPSELLTGADKASPLKSPNKTLCERHFMDAIDVSSDTFSDESEFTKTKLKEDDDTKPSYSVTLGLQTDIPSVTDKIMYPRSSFILKCLKRLENKHKNIPDSKPCGRKNLFESLENVSEDSKSCNISQCKDEKYTKNVDQTQSEKNVLTKPVEEVVVYPKPVDPKNLEYRKPTFIIPTDEEILNYTDDTVVRKQPELDSVSPENGRELLQILAKTLGIFPSTKTKPLETSLSETPKKYKETVNKDAVDDENGMQIIVMNNTAESNEYTMGIDVINVPKSINEDLKKAASELENNCVFEEDNPQGLAYPVEDTSSEKKAQSTYERAKSDPGDISIPKEVYEFLEDYNTISPKAPEPRHDAQILQPTRDIHMVPGPKLNTSEVVDIHFNFCSKETPRCEHPKSHRLASSNAHNVNPVADLKPLQNNEQETPFGPSVNIRDDVLQTKHLQSNEDLPLYAIPVGYVSENCQTSSGTTCYPENQSTLSISQPLNQDNETACNQTPSKLSRPLKELSVSIPSQMSSEKSDVDPVFSHSNVFKSENAQKPSVQQSIPKVSESTPESDQVWSRILEEYKAERMQNHNNRPEESSLSHTAKQQKPRTLSYEENTDSFISKPVFTRSYSTSATSTLSNASNQTLQHDDNSEKVFMSCSFSPTNSSNSLKMIFRKERSPKEENQSVNASSEERICSPQTVNIRDPLRETNLSTADSEPSLEDVGATDDDEEESLPYMIVDTGVEICRKALGTHEDEEEDLSEEEDWISGQDVESQDAVT